MGSRPLKSKLGHLLLAGPSSVLLLLVKSEMLVQEPKPGCTMGESEQRVLSSLSLTLRETSQGAGKTPRKLNCEHPKS